MQVSFGYIGKSELQYSQDHKKFKQLRVRLKQFEEFKIFASANIPDGKGS